MGPHPLLGRAQTEVESSKKAGALNLGARQKDLPILKEAANRWTVAWLKRASLCDQCRAPGSTPSTRALGSTDNLFVIKKQLVDKYGMEPKQARALRVRRSAAVCSALPPSCAALTHRSPR